MTVPTSFPRILIVSEATLDREKMGASQTLYNLFVNYPPERLMLYTSNLVTRSSQTGNIKHSIAEYPEQYFPRINRRLLRYLNPLVDALNLQMHDLLPIPKLEACRVFQPDLILICPIGATSMVLGARLARTMDRPHVIYFMDDILHHLRSRWPFRSKSIQAIGGQVLRDAAGWLLISRQLKETLLRRYKLQSPPSLIVHNPVELPEKSPVPAVARAGNTFQIAYAGSIWPMHKDALLHMARAVAELRGSGWNIELVVYTADHFWNFLEAEFTTYHVRRGGFIPYTDLNRVLQKADLLLVTTSFAPREEHMVRSSVLTKLTDYMATGQPILSYGPPYSACHQFLRDWNCGFVCDTNQVAEVSKELIRIIDDEQTRSQRARTAFDVLRENFTKSHVQNKLYTFLHEAVARQNRSGEPSPDKIP